MEILHTIGSIASIVGIWRNWETPPNLLCGSFMLILVGLPWFIYRRYYRSLREIRKGISIIKDKLDRANYHPDLIIAFNRTGVLPLGCLRSTCELKK